MKEFEFADAPKHEVKKPQSQPTGIVMYGKNSTSAKATISKEQQREQEKKLKEYRKLVQAQDYDPDLAPPKTSGQMTKAKMNQIESALKKSQPDPNIILPKVQEDAKAYDGHLKPMRQSLASGNPVQVKQLTFDSVPMLKEHAEIAKAQEEHKKRFGKDRQPKPVYPQKNQVLTKLKDKPVTDSNWLQLTGNNQSNLDSQKLTKGQFMSDQNTRQNDQQDQSAKKYVMDTKPHEPRKHPVKQSIAAKKFYQGHADRKQAIGVEEGRLKPKPRPHTSKTAAPKVTAIKPSSGLDYKRTRQQRQFDSTATNLFEDYDTKQQTLQDKRQETKRELQQLLTHYLGQEGIRKQVIAAEMEREQLGKKHEEAKEMMFYMNQDFMRNQRSVKELQTYLDIDKFNAAYQEKQLFKKAARCESISPNSAAQLCKQFWD